MILHLARRFSLSFAGIIISILIATASYAQSKGQPNCDSSTLIEYLKNELSFKDKFSEAFTKLLAQTESRYLSKAEEDTIKKIFLDSSIAQIEKNRQVFEIVLKARLRPLDEGTRIVVEGLVKSRVSFNPELDSSSLHHTILLDIVIGGMPENYKYSVFYYAELLHEIEHAIQTVEFEAVLDNPKYMNMYRVGIDGKMALRYWFLMETGAMQAEWHFPSLIPEALRNEIITQVKQDQMLTPKMQRTFLSLLDGAPTTFKHLQNEWESGRYEMKGLRMHRLEVLKSMRRSNEKH